MTDRTSPRIVADELATVLALLDHRRTSPVDEVRGVTAAQAAWSPVPSGTSHRWLITHPAGAAGPVEPCRDGVARPPVTLRWVVAHLLEGTARHAGHADILRELIDGSVGR